MKSSISRQGKIRNSSTGYTGVEKVKGCNSYTCCITHNKVKYRKNFTTPELAAIAYDKMALYLYGENATLNLPKLNTYTDEEMNKTFLMFTNKK